MNDAFHKYSTIGQLTNATVVTQPPPIFARYMLRKSVDRLTTEVRFLRLLFEWFDIFLNFSFELLMSFDTEWIKWKAIDMEKQRDTNVLVEMIWLKNNRGAKLFIEVPFFVSYSTFSILPICIVIILFFLSVYYLYLRITSDISIGKHIHFVC